MISIFRSDKKRFKIKYSAVTFHNFFAYFDYGINGLWYYQKRVVKI